MAVNVIWSYTNGGEAISAIINHGNAANGDTTTVKEIFLRHDGSNEITNVGIYVRDYSGTYAGDATASSDLIELLSWGDASTIDTFGGFQVNMDAVGAYPAASWPAYDDKSPSNGFVHRTGVGDSEGNAVTLAKAAGIADPYVAGELPSGNSPNVRFKARIQVPTAEDTAGIRQFDQVVRFAFTS